MQWTCHSSCIKNLTCLQVQDEWGSPTHCWWERHVAHCPVKRVLRISAQRLFPKEASAPGDVPGCSQRCSGHKNKRSGCDTEKVTTRTTAHCGMSLQEHTAVTRSAGIYLRMDGRHGETLSRWRVGGRDAGCSPGLIRGPGPHQLPFLPPSRGLLRAPPAPFLSLWSCLSGGSRSGLDQKSSCGHFKSACNGPRVILTYYFILIYKQKAHAWEHTVNSRLCVSGCLISVSKGFVTLFVLKRLTSILHFKQ